jgi:hypothetical protein
MNPVGLHFDWRVLNQGDNSPATELVVVNFTGRCDVREFETLPFTSGPLGWTHVSQGVVLPFSDVDCNAVRAFLQNQLRTRPEAVREEIYGRALGRVLAHELYHVLAGTVDHGACGIAKSGYTVSDLLSRDFVFEAAELRTLLNSKVHQLLVTAAALSSVAP